MMLVLSRKKDEQIVIGDDVIVHIIEIRGDKVRIGVLAPKELRVDRLEVRRARDRAAMEAKGKT